MRFAYLDCFAGISGDMFLGALLDAGVPPHVLQEAVAALNLDASLQIETVTRSGISGTRVIVLEGDAPAEKEHQHPHPEATSPEVFHSPVHNRDRSLRDITNIIQNSNLSEQIKSIASAIFSLLGNSEAKIHNTPVEEIHFHEVGAVDAIVDIVCAAVGIAHLKIDQWFSSPINVGGGMVQCAHGLFPVPAPATADLLRGIPTYSAHLQKELVTPTGAAILKFLSPSFGPQPAMQVESIGYGAGTRNPESFPNVLRLSLGVSTETVADDTVTVLETAIDDLSPQVLAFVTEQALAQGALDVMATAVHMKKNRLGTLITILAAAADAPALERLLLTETTTLGIRIRQDRRVTLDRHHTTVETPYGPIRIKVGSLKGEELNAAPEFEDCRTAATQYGVALKKVIQAALTAYTQR